VSSCVQQSELKKIQIIVLLSTITAFSFPFLTPPHLALIFTYVQAKTYKNNM